MVEQARPVRRPVLLPTIALAYVVLIVFWPVLGSEFVDLDVDEQVINNPHIRGLGPQNLKHIFTSRCISSYYPVRTLTYAVDYQIWGLDPAKLNLADGLVLTINGFKLTNLLLHFANVLLVFWLIVRMFDRSGQADGWAPAWWDASLATLAAAVFAVHPVVVEPVSWVAGREELLMTLGALGCLHFHLSARRLAAEGKTGKAAACHLAAASACAAACLSNAVAAVIPLLITGWDALTLTGAKSGKILRGTFALWLIGAATIAVKLLGSRDHTVVEGIGLFSPERVMMVLTAYWLQLETVFWPLDLAFLYDWTYPRSFLETGVLLGGIAAVLTAGLFWMLRRRRLALFGTLWFVVALAPTLHVMPHHIFRADRFLYLPLVGLVAALAITLRPLAKGLRGSLAGTGVIAAGILLLLVLDTLSDEQVHTWRSRFSVWEQSLEVAPDNAVAQCSFANRLAKRGQFRRAIAHYDKALTFDPDSTQALNNFALLLTTCPEEGLRDYDLGIAMAKRGCDLTGWADRQLCRTLATAYTAVAGALGRSGKVDRAAEYYGKAIGVAEDAGDTRLSVELRRQLESYRDPAQRPNRSD